MDPIRQNQSITAENPAHYLMRCNNYNTMLSAEMIGLVSCPALTRQQPDIITHNVSSAKNIAPTVGTPGPAGMAKVGDVGVERSQCVALLPTLYVSHSAPSVARICFFMHPNFCM